MELTDLEVCKRIAEIDGIYNKIKKAMDDHQKNHDSFRRSTPSGCSNPYNVKPFEQLYNPLTDDGLCFQLSKKYNVSIMHFEEYSTARIWDDPEDNPIADFSTINNDTNLNRAICLAIIESHKLKGK